MSPPPVTLSVVCLLVFAWRVHPQLPLIVAGNRDEFHDRPTAAAGWWSDRDGVLAGRDLRAGGSWLGVNRDGRIAVVTNYREPERGTWGPRSRGELVVDHLTSCVPAGQWMDALGHRKADYAGFNLIVGDGDRLHYLTNRGNDRRDLEPGLYGLSNHRLDTPWPKVRAAKEGLRRRIEDDDVTSDSLFALLADRRPAADAELPATGVPRDWERLLSSVFIVNPRYGTRAGTVVLVRGDGAVVFEERRFAADGTHDDSSRFELPGQTTVR